MTGNKYLRTENTARVTVSFSRQNFVGGDDYQISQNSLISKLW